VALAATAPSVRHRVKSRLLLAAATTVGGDLDRARELAAEVAAECRVHDLLPLRWACAMLRTGLDDGGAAAGADAAAEADRCARALAAHGGVLRGAPEVQGHL
jgi:hypothetical protein